ncbi:hypothetical protein AQJ91_40830 [Streptomyces dysideae]|uniref:Uncharacterized protein n=1 Tax=Streptomyces dysideae TaxID=909626 RepID=A0A117RXY5_9ACTN|nr:hypothetical protein AQJ91_40830 [Streptomyces dysideae]
MLDPVETGQALEFGEQVVQGVLGGAAVSVPPADASACSAPAGRDGFLTSRDRQSSNTGRAPFFRATSSSVSRTRQPRSTGAHPARHMQRRERRTVAARPGEDAVLEGAAVSPTNRLFFPVRATVTDLTRGSACGPTTSPEPAASRTVHLRSPRPCSTNRRDRP